MGTFDFNGDRESVLKKEKAADWLMPCGLLEGALSVAS
jgi:hypothetical protein